MRTHHIFFIYIVLLYIMTARNFLLKQMPEEDFIDMIDRNGKTLKELFMSYCEIEYLLGTLKSIKDNKYKCKIRVKNFKDGRVLVILKDLDQMTNYKIKIEKDGTMKYI